MKITKLTTYPVPPRWLFLKIDTDEGIAGWGEPALEGRAATVAAAVGELSDYLVGKDPRRIEDHWQVLYRAGFYRGGPVLMSAIAGIDQALWDIKGKWHGTSVADLMGGPVRDRIRVYTWIGGDRPADIAAAAASAVERGFTAMKMNGMAELQIVDTPAKVSAIVENIAAARSAVGPDIDIAVDFHGRVHRHSLQRRQRPSRLHHGTRHVRLLRRLRHHPRRAGARHRRQRGLRERAGP